MIKVTVKGDYKKTEKYLKRVQKMSLDEYLNRAGVMGVAMLAAYTPIDSGRTASSWDYEIHKSHDMVKIVWTNSNTSNGIPIAVLIQYGHATRNGGYVEGRDFINPAIQPVFDKLAEDIWTEVTRE